MIYASIAAGRYKAAMQERPIVPTLSPRKAGADVRAHDTFTAQTPLVVIGLAAIGMILLINSHARPTPSSNKPVVVYACADCGTVVAVRRTAHSVPSYTVEVQMLDGSLRTIQQLATGFNVGDIVQVSGNALILRSAAS